MSDGIHEAVREAYAARARAVANASGSEAEGACCGEGCGCGCCCCATATAASFGSDLYGDEERGSLPEAALLASLGCGNPTAVAELRPGETVLDLGSGGGIDVLLSARRVGPSGKVYGLDMTEEMLQLARRNAADAGAPNVEFLKGLIEVIPLPADTIDVVISNCVVNLAADKGRVFEEIARVLRPGGRIGISDIVAADGLDQSERAERGSYVGCIAGALSVSEYEAGLRRVGLDEVEVRLTHEVADRMYGAIVRAVKPAAASIEPAMSRAALPGSRHELPVVGTRCCG